MILENYTIFNLLITDDWSRWKEASKACALDQVGGEVEKMVKDIKEQDTLGLLSKGEQYMGRTSGTFAGSNIRALCYHS